MTRFETDEIFLCVGNKRKSHLDANYRVSHQFTSSNLDFFIGSSTKPRKGSNDGIVYLNQGNIMWELNLSTKNSPCQSMACTLLWEGKEKSGSVDSLLEPPPVPRSKWDDSTTPAWMKSDSASVKLVGTWGRSAFGPVRYAQRHGD